MWQASASSSVLAFKAKYPEVGTHIEATSVPSLVLILTDCFFLRLRLQKVSLQRI